MIGRIQLILIMCLFSIIYIRPVWAQDTPPKHRIAPTTNGTGGTQSTFTADLDGDNDSDVLTAGFGGKIAWYENEDGQFTAPRVITTDASEALAVHAADLNGDLSVDVLSASENRISWYKNTDNDFSGQKVITENVVAGSSVFDADMDGDGDKDVVSGSAGNNKIAWYKNSGDGSFSGQIVISDKASTVRSVYLSDFDSDGDEDIVFAASPVASNGDRISWHENQIDEGAGFSDENIIADDVEDPESVYAADLDKDGDPDVLAALQGNDKVVAYDNQLSESGDFGPAIVLDANADGAYAVSAADVDGDGYKDVISTTFSSKDVRWYENLTNESGGFSDGRVIETTRYIPRALHADDLDGDDDADVLSGGDNRIEWHENIVGSSQKFKNAEIIAPKNPIEGASSINAADLDGDGDQDVVSAADHGGMIAWHENLQDKGFSAPSIITTEVERPQSVYAADLNGDELVDVLSASSGDDKIAWYPNEGGNFSQQRVIMTSADGAISVRGADFDKDGDTDVLSASHDGSEIILHVNKGGGDFEDPEIIVDNITNVNSIFIADVDNDDYKDIFFAYKRVISLIENNNGDLDEVRGIRSISDDYAPVIFGDDINGDNKIDLIFDRPRLSWVKNLGDDFSSRKTINSDVRGMEDIHSADIDEDGDTDIFVASDGEDRISWYENKKSFDQISFDRQTVSTARRPRSLHIEDLDEDGDSDILAALGRQNAVVWYENTSSALPVDLTDLNAKVSGGDRVVLEWLTVSETNNSGFDVQHQPPTSERWRTLGFVNSKAAGGSTNETHFYKYTAEDLAVGGHKFRLRQVDLSGSTSLSRAVSVQIGMDQAIKLTPPSPNPVSHTATTSFAVKNDGSQVVVRLFNMLGQEVSVLYEGRPAAGETHRLHFNVGDLSAGMYLIRLEVGEKAKSERFMVVR